MRPGAITPPFSVDARAERFQRRITGPWETKVIGPVVWRRRWHPKIEACRLSVSLRDVERAWWFAVAPPLSRLATRISGFLARPS